MNSTFWQTTDRDGIKDADASVVPEEPAIYIWKRRINVSEHARATGSDFRDWVKDLVKSPFGKLTTIPLNPIITIDSMTIGGQVLTDKKVDTLKNLSKTSKGRAAIVKYLNSLSDQLPSIYIGETKNLRTRLNAHINGQTYLQGYLQELGLEWDDVEVRFCRLEQMADSELIEDESVRTFIEMITQRLLAPFGTKRSG